MFAAFLMSVFIICEIKLKKVLYTDRKKLFSITTDSKNNIIIINKNIKSLILCLKENFVDYPTVWFLLI